MTKAIFWDLQGTLGGDAIGSIENFIPYSFSKDALLLSKNNGYLNIIITNQSNIGKGTLSFDVYQQHAKRIADFFNSDGRLIDEFLCCPHQSSDNCTCKKPKIGLIIQSAGKYGIDISKSYVIGDMGKNEIIMAHNAGCKGVLVLTGGGKDSLSKFRHTWNEHTADIVANNVLEAIKEITST